MKYATSSDFRRALETRLRTLSQREGVSLARLRKLVAFDRLLARLRQARSLVAQRAQFARLGRRRGTSVRDSATQECCLGSKW